MWLPDRVGTSHGTGFLLQIAFATNMRVRLVGKMSMMLPLWFSLPVITCIEAGHTPQRTQASSSKFYFLCSSGLLPESDLPPFLHHHLKHENPWGKIRHKEKYCMVIMTQVLRRWAHSPTTCYSTEQSLTRKEKAQGINSFIIIPLYPSPSQWERQSLF